MKVFDIFVILFVFLMQGFIIYATVDGDLKKFSSITIAEFTCLATVTFYLIARGY